MVEIILHNEKGPAVVEAGTQGTKKEAWKKNPKKETELLFSVCGGQNEGVKPSPKQLLNIRDLVHSRTDAEFIGVYGQVLLPLLGWSF